MFVAAKVCLSRQNLYRDEIFLSRRNIFVATKRVCRDRTSVATKMIVVAAPANDKIRQWLEEGCRKPVLGVWLRPRALQGAAMLIHSLPVLLSGTRLARDVLGAFAAHSSLVHDVTDDRLFTQLQYGSAKDCKCIYNLWQHSRSCFHDSQ